MSYDNGTGRILQYSIKIALISVSTLFWSAQIPDSVTRILENCVYQTGKTKYYDPQYQALRYPMGDVDISRGVCTDVLVRAFRAAGVDFQRLIHEDMKDHFSEYPQKWGLKKPDRNIDHRRVPNIVTYLKRTGRELAISDQAQDYQPGDLVTWKIPGNLDHIGIVSNVLVEGTNRYGIFHNIGNGAVLEDVLFEYTITGHFRYFKLKF